MFTGNKFRGWCGQSSKSKGSGGTNKNKRDGEFAILENYPEMPEPVIPPGRLAQIDVSCVDVP